MRKVILLICFLFILIGCNKENDKMEIIKVTCDEAMTLQNEGALVIDVREKDEYDTNHLDGAINISYTKISEDITKYTDNLDQKIIVYCQSGIRSNKAANTLITMGYTHIYDLGSINNCN